MSKKEAPPSPVSLKTGESRLLGNAYIRAVNQANILDLFRSGQQLSRTDISRICNLTKPTVSAIVEQLIADDVLREAGMGPSEGGRRARLLEFNPGSSTFIGIHFGEDTTHVAITDALGRKLARRTATTVAGKPDASMEIARVLINESLSEIHQSLNKVTAVGVSVPGLVDRQSGACKIAPNLDWHNYPVAEKLSALLGVDVFVANTTQNAALAEHQMGVARGLQNFIWVYVGKGVGSCAVIGGRVQLGSRGFAGEIGHCKIEAPGVLCGCGKRGCLETTCANQAIVREAKKQVDSGRPTSLSELGNRVTAWDVSMIASEGDTVAQKIMTDAGRALGQGIATLLNVFDPQMVVIGGPVAGTDEHFLEGVRDYAARNCLESCGAEIVFSHLGSDIYLIGAVLMAMEQSNAAYRIVKTTKALDDQTNKEISVRWSEL
ncbi:MAG: ROK family protein [Deltaproteobacteria bacterium]|nr:ROK family protein [Deltaproteobacteria bacterium]